MGAVKHTQRTRTRVLSNFQETGRIDLACAAAGADRASHYRWLKQFPDYARKFEEVREHAVDLLEAEAWRRASEGIQEPVFSHGKRAADFVIDPKTGKPEVDLETGKLKSQPAFVRRYSDQLLMFLLKGRRREVYGDRLEATGKDGKPLFDIASMRAYLNAEPDDDE